MALSGCVLLELSEVGALEVAAEAGLATTAEASAIDALSTGGFELRALPEGAEVIADGRLVSGRLRTELEGLAGRNGLQLVSDEGALTISDSRLTITSEGAIYYQESASKPMLVGRITSDGSIFDLSHPGVPKEPIGRLRGTARTPRVAIVASPTTNAQPVVYLKPGQAVEVLRVDREWLEVRVGQIDGWAPVDALLLSLSHDPHPLPAAGPWITWGDSVNDQFGVARLVLDKYDALASDANCAGLDNFACFIGRLPHDLYIEHLITEFRRLRSSHRAVRILWADSGLAIVQLKEELKMGYDTDTWECVAILLQRSQAGEWMIEKRGSLWSCHEPNPYETPFK